MRHDVIGLFSQPITKIKIDNPQKVVDIFDNIVKTRADLNEVDSDGYPIHASYENKNLVHYHNRQNVFDLYQELENVKKQIMKASNFVYIDVLNYESEMKITNAWFNEAGIGAFQHYHNHSNCVLAGTLYLRTGPDSIIQFQKPTQSSDVVNAIVDDANLEKNNQFGYNFHYEMVSISVESGDCLFWPAYLKHGYPPNETEGRLSLSFNLMPKKLSSMYLI